MIPLFKVFMPAEVDAPLLEVLHGGYIAQGQKVEEFELAFQDFIGFDQVLSLNSGTSALSLALRLAGVEAGDDVITTAMTCSATNEPILQMGATPIFADIDPKSGNVTLETIKAAYEGSNAKAVMVVDWGGQPCDIEEIQRWCDDNYLKLIEDAAHALGAQYSDGSYVGSGKADFTCFSLQAIKHITTGDGGMLSCKNWNDYLRGQRLRWFGIDRYQEKNVKDSRIDQDILEWGYKYHMNDINATIGLASIKYAKRQVDAYQSNAARYRFAADNHCERTSYAQGLSTSSSWLFTLLYPNREKREMARAYFEGKGIMVSQVHRRNDTYTVFKPYANKKMPGLTEFYDTMLCIPVHWALTEEEITLIRDTIIEFDKRFL